MDKKYYLDKDGTIKLLQEVSSLIRSKTSGQITIQNGEVQNPNNFTTVNAVVDYLRNRSNLKINQQAPDGTPLSYIVVDNEKNYNGEQEVEIDIKLIESSDIDGLFNN